MIHATHEVEYGGCAISAPAAVENLTKWRKIIQSCNKFK
jgi:hypothetical protein